MFNIRENVFETNSSSSHSICFNKKDKTNDIPDIRQHLDKNGTWLLTNDMLQFGRYPFRILTTASEKIRYAIACACIYPDYPGDDSLEKITNTVKEICPEFERFAFEQTIDGDSTGGTDDQILFDCLQDKQIPLKDFITDSRYFIVCDGDEYLTFDALHESGLIHKNIVKLYPAGYNAYD